MTKPPTVDAYAAALAPEARQTFGELRAFLRELAPDAAELISYQMPALKQNGRIVLWFAGWKGHASLYPVSDAVREALGTSLAPYLGAKATIHLPNGKRLPKTLIRTFVRTRLREIEAATRKR